MVWVLDEVIVTAKKRNSKNVSNEFMINGTITDRSGFSSPQTETVLVMQQVKGKYGKVYSHRYLFLEGSFWKVFKFCGSLGNQELSWT